MTWPGLTNLSQWPHLTWSKPKAWQAQARPDQIALLCMSNNKVCWCLARRYDHFKDFKRHLARGVTLFFSLFICFNISRGTIFFFFKIIVHFFSKSIWNVFKFKISSIPSPLKAAKEKSIKSLPYLKFFALNLFTTLFHKFLKFTYTWKKETWSSFRVKKIIRLPISGRSQSKHLNKNSG